VILGMSTAAYTQFHVIISLVAIAAGFVVTFGLLTGRRFNRWTLLFLVLTIATSITGYAFPFHKITPAHIVGAISLVLLSLAVAARYRFRLAGGWRKTYVITALVSQYLNVFVLVVQSFQKVPALHALAPTQTEPPFAAAQISLLLLFAILTTLATMRFRDVAVQAA
jgi:hypothetical protein